MSATGVYLSICIPTYNRDRFLRQTLESITCQDAFINTDEIEVIISDNVSTDDTQVVGQEFEQRFPGKVKYFKNETNLGTELNLERVLARGEGICLKLQNDNLTMRDGSLAELVKVIKATEAEKPILFFTNGNNNVHGVQLTTCNNLDEFVQAASYFTTWMGGFCIWRDEFRAIPDFTASAKTQLIQTDILLRLMETGKRAIVFYGVYFIGLPIGKKGGYNIAEVFGKNYLAFLKKYMAMGLLREETYQREKRLILINHIIPYYFDKTNGFHKNGFFVHMQDYLHDDYFYQAIEGLLLAEPAAAPAASAPAVASAPPAPDPVQVRNMEIADHWRHLNAHNEVSITRWHGFVDFNKVKAGRRSYGGLELWLFGGAGESLTIGNFVSIADDVKFLLGGNHPYQGLSTFPFATKYFATLEAGSKGPIVVEDDVWIGYNSTILSGVTIGQGAIIAAGSMVTKDVAPYSIVGGNPARLIKYRFDQAVIDRLLDFDFSSLSDETILKNREALYQELTSDNVDVVLQKLQHP
ncbi:Acetyltransferase (isoleucine patch superfamily) [Duganella sp. CF402]|uniref:glycosyltransferase n=1 Tax=unclassified Duganella TaxID=2636909 RepID=UPI0008ACD38E|nr:MULTISPECIES: glycosyltransferase [unclassified Duganella]RZT05402.1 acetyltransferase-like isoleucine patch superfamily enzyme [Duganella sp. BK701]SEN08968.1 Acetyltransferase (isoleucine patch superfamily) [Duganella sp. CF402]